MSGMFVRFFGLVLIASLLVPAGASAAPGANGEMVHVVQWGETLSLIADKYGVTMEAIMAANGLDDPNMIYVGQRLSIPGAGSRGGGCDYYTVQAGDTLTGIAWRYGTTANALTQANDLDSDLIYVGQRLCVPGDDMGQMPSQPSREHTYYTVRAGDTLAAIALRFGVSQTAIVHANNLANASLIYVGQRLVIPGGDSMDHGQFQPGMAPAPAPGYGPTATEPQAGPYGGQMGQSPQPGQGAAPAPGYAPMGTQPQGSPYGGQMGQPPQPGQGVAPAPAPGYAPMGTQPQGGAYGGQMGQPPQQGQGMAPAPAPGYQPPQAGQGTAPAPPPAYQPSPASTMPRSGQPVVIKSEPQWVGSQTAHNADPDEITTLLVMVHEGEGKDVMIRSKDGFVARGFTGVYFEYSWIPTFAFRNIPGGEYEVWIDGEPSRTVRVRLDPGFRALVEFKWKIVSTGGMISPSGWFGEVVENTSGNEPIGAFSILVVRTGAIGNKIRVTAPGGYEAVCITGTKLEQGTGACDVGGLNAGTYQVILDGADIAVELYLDGIGTALVEFRPVAVGDPARQGTQGW